jgi:N-acetylglutamate synthase-like GNAT family acetyltransferase
VIRRARPEDVPQICALIRELAEYERSLPEVVATQDQVAFRLTGRPLADLAASRGAVRR